MAETIVNSPIGEVTINHPEGASEQQILAFAKREVGRRQARRAELEEEFSKNPATGLSDSSFENFLAGAGKAFVDLGRGAKQLGVEGANLIPGVNLQGQVDDLRQSQRDTRELDNPLLSTKAGLGGNISANVGLALAPGGLARGGTGAASGALRAFSNPNTFRAAAASGAIQGALQPVADDELRSVNVGLGAGLGVLGRGLTRPFANKASAAQTRAIQALDDANVPLDVAERTGSGAAKRLAAMLDDSILTGTQRQAFKDQQLSQFTRAALRTIGQEADEATPAVMLRAKNQIGSVFDRFARNSPMRADTNFFNSMAQIFDDAQRTLTRSELRLFERNFSDILSSVDNGAINGSRFTSHLRTLGNLAKRADVGEHARSMEHALLDALERSSPPGVVDDLINARGQWRNLRTLQGAIGKGEERFVSPLRLSNAIAQKRNQGLSVFGQGSSVSRDLAELAQAGRTILGDLANSGTPARQQLPTAGLLGGLAAVGGAPAAAGGAAGVVALPSVLQNQGVVGNFLTNGLGNGPSAPIIQSIINRGLLFQERQLE